MNGKQLAEALNNGESFEKLAEVLIDDAEALIKARNAKLDSAKRSCYMEQDAKWKSACRKLGLGVEDLDKFTDYLRSSKRVSNKVMADDGMNDHRERMGFLDRAKRVSELEQAARDSARNVEGHFQSFIVTHQKMVANGELKSDAITERELYDLASRESFKPLITGFIPAMAKDKGPSGVAAAIGFIGKILWSINEPRFNKELINDLFIVHTLSLDNLAVAAQARMVLLAAGGKF